MSDMGGYMVMEVSMGLHRDFIGVILWRLYGMEVSMGFMGFYRVI